MCRYLKVSADIGEDDGRRILEMMVLEADCSPVFQPGV